MPDMTLKQKMLYIGGSKQSYHCSICGCNVFTEFEPKMYECNGCGTIFTSRNKEASDG